MVQFTCNASYKKKGNTNETFICNRKANYTTTNGTPCCGYHKKAVFLKEDVFEEFECSICYDTCHSKEEQYVTHCNHSFHTNCMKKWAQSSKILSCPLCRTEIKNHEFKCMTNTIWMVPEFSVAESFDRIANENMLSQEERVILRDRVVHVCRDGQNVLDNILEIMESNLRSNANSTLTIRQTIQNTAYYALLREIVNNINQ